MFKHILLPTDGSEISRITARRAVSFAQEAGATITVFHAKPDYPFSFLGEGGLVDPCTPETYAEMTEAQAQKYLSEVEEMCKAANVPCNKMSKTNSLPHEAIIEAAESAGCDLIFMASHGRRGLSGLLLGSETNKVLTHTNIPVLVYRQNKEAD